MDLVTEVYRASSAFPDNETYGLIAQMRRAAVSAPSDIAEGQGRQSTGEFKQFLGHARGSLYELETQMLVVERLKMTNGGDIQSLQSLIDEVGRMLNGLIRSLNKKKE